MHRGEFHIPAEDHIGDGVYVSFDGYQLWLSANEPGLRQVALEPEVFRELIAYARRIDEAAGTPYFGVPGKW